MGLGTKYKPAAFSGSGYKAKTILQQLKYIGKREEPFKEGGGRSNFYFK